MESKLLKAVRTDNQTYNRNTYISQRKSAQKYCQTYLVEILNIPNKLLGLS